MAAKGCSGWETEPEREYDAAGRPGRMVERWVTDADLWQSARIDGEHAAGQPERKDDDAKATGQRGTKREYERVCEAYERDHAERERAMEAVEQLPEGGSVPCAVAAVLGRRHVKPVGFAAWRIEEEERWRAAQYKLVDEYDAAVAKWEACIAKLTAGDSSPEVVAGLRKPVRPPEYDEVRARLESRRVEERKLCEERKARELAEKLKCIAAYEQTCSKWEEAVALVKRGRQDYELLKRIEDLPVAPFGYERAPPAEGKRANRRDWQ